VNQNKPLRLGIVGASPGNGHPFSFSAIINGYDSVGMADAGWDGIHRYLDKQDPADIGFPNARITHVWTQDAEISAKIARACKVDIIANELSDLIGIVDGLIIARDDADTHAQMAMPFLEAGIPVFVDKPLTVDAAEFSAFKPYLASGLLMSCSGLRFARETDEFRGNPNAVGDLVSVQCGVIKGWDRYGIHMIDAVLGAFPNVTPEWLVRNGDSWLIGCTNGQSVTISCLGDNAPVFAIQVLGREGGRQIKISDNFTAFRRTMQRFVRQIETGEPQVPLEQTVASLSLLLTGKNAKDGVVTTIEQL